MPDRVHGDWPVDMAKSYNSTHEVLNAAIYRLEEQLEDAREMPPWAIALVVMMSVIVPCCLFQAMIIMIIPRAKSRKLSLPLNFFTFSTVSVTIPVPIISPLVNSVSMT